MKIKTGTREIKMEKQPQKLRNQKKKKSVNAKQVVNILSKSSKQKIKNETKYDTVNQINYSRKHSCTS